MRRSTTLFALLALTAALGLADRSAAARRVQGPITGRIEAEDGAAIEDAVVRLRCAGHDLHGASATDRETRIVSSGERFLFLWAWGGLSPVGCSVRVHHPLYVTSYTPVGDDFSNDLGTIRLQSWQDFLAAGPTDPPMHSAYPWPALEIQQHLHGARLYWLPAHPERAYPALELYVPALRATFERAVSALPTSWHDDSPWNLRVRKRLRAIEQATGWQRPAATRALTEASSAGDTERVRALLAGGADPDARGDDGAAALHRAAEAGNLELARLLVEAGASLERQREGSGDTPLLDAVQHHQDDVTLFLLERGADPTFSAWRGPPLQAVAQQNASRRVVEALIAHGAISRARDEMHVLRAFHAAARSNHTAVLEPMLAAGVPPDVSVHPPGWTALMLAAKRGRVQATRVLIEAGADVDARSEDGQTPLGNAREGGHDEVVALLLAAGAAPLAPPAAPTPGD